jgi:hypothetical protein
MKESIMLTIVISLILCGWYVFFEPALAGAASSTANTAVSLTVTGEINLNCSSTVILSPNIAGQTGGTATGTFGCLVTTNNSTGYNLKIEKNQKLQIANVADQRFDDYTTSSTYSDWSFAAPGSGNETFGFNIVSCASTTDIVQGFRDDGSANCGTGNSVTPWHCFAPVPTTPATAQTIANRTTATPSAGILTILGLQAVAGGSNNLNSGTYNCTTTITATTN